MNMVFVLGKIPAGKPKKIDGLGLDLMKIVDFEGLRKTISI